MNDELRRRSRWMMRVREWDDRAQYPNIWNDGMPCHVLAVDRVAGRLRLGDLIAVFYPNSKRHAERSGRFVGLSRVSGLRTADQPGCAWIDLATAHRFEPPLDLGRQPARVFLCCDPGWSGPEQKLFADVFEAAVAAGWKPLPEEAELVREAPAPRAARAAAKPDAAETAAASGGESVDMEPPSAPPVDRPPVASSGNGRAVAEATGRLFGGVDYSGDMRDPRNGTWLATLELAGDRLRVRRLEPTGRSGLEGYLRNPDTGLMNVEAIGLDFPFGLPLAFAEKLLGGPFPDEGWWALAKRLERLTRPEYLTHVHDFRESEGEARRLTDERADAHSPLKRVDPDMGSRAFHGIRMIAEDRSRFAMRPFESAQGKLLLEVYPEAVVREVAARVAEGRPGLRRIVTALGSLERLPVDVDPEFARACMSRRDALDAVVAARCAALAVLSGEVDRTPDELAPGEGSRVRCEGWIYGLSSSG
jgi:hypothetical protein